VSRPAILPVPEFALKLLFGEGATVLTQGQRVLPERTQSLGYRFNYETIGPALTSIVA
jgi:NAD dependent epimerase/dehydratase family enzyme